jgi:hypothetical protein
MTAGVVEFSQLGKNAMLHFVANSYANVAGNTSNSDIAVGNEVVLGASISYIWWGSSNQTTNWSVARGGNTIMTLNGTGAMDFLEGDALIAGSNSSVNALSSNVVVTLNGGGTGFVRVRMHKNSNVNQQTLP